jgi:hypothetical protein
LKLDLATAPVIEDAMHTALVIAARDVLLDELLGIARREGIAEILLQAAVSNLPVTPRGLASMLAGDSSNDLQFVDAAISKLESLSLLHRFPDGTVWVHRWTAEVLVGLGDTVQYHARAIRAGPTAVAG